MSERFTLDAPVVADVDVLVCGGGPAGIGAALAAARQGASTMIVEQQGCLGGVATSGLIGTWFGSYSRDGRYPVVEGIFKEIVDELVAQNAAKPPTNDPQGGSAYSGYAPWHKATVPCEFEAAKRLFDRLALEAGVSLRYFTSALYPRPKPRLRTSISTLRPTRLPGEGRLRRILQRWQRSSPATWTG